MSDSNLNTAKDIQVIFLIWISLVVGVSLGIPNSAHAEYIDSFTAKIEVQQDSSFTVSEEIAYVFTEEGKHGIYRCIPTTHSEQASTLLKERYFDIDSILVAMDGKEVQFGAYNDNDQVCVKIGDPDATVTVGQHAYTIKYTVRGALSYPKNGGADLYWNVTGNGWDVPMRTVSTEVSSPEPILRRERSCYQGFVGKTNSCVGITEREGAVIFSGGPLNPKEGVTIAQSLDRSRITLDIRERYKTVWILGIVSIIGLFILVFALYRYKTKFKTDAPIIPQYEPYPGVKPMYAGYLFDRRLDPRDITAGIVYLAKEGFIRIKKIDRKVLFFFEVDDFELTLLKDMSEISDTFERDIADLIFDNSAKAGTVRTLSELKGKYSEAQQNRVLLMNLKVQMGKDLVSQGYFVGFDFSKMRTTKFVVSIVVLAVVISQVPVPFQMALVTIPIVSIVIILMGRRTKKGYEALDHLKGFKDFLSVTEKDRYLFHNAPEKNAEQFMEYLPYAIAFGVEKQWAKTFEGITIPNPNWYDGGSTGHTFSSLALTQSLGGFSSAFASSSGSGGSASSGGGSSGGGSGGGGGGSW